MSYQIDDAFAELKSLSIETPKKPRLPDDKLLEEYEHKIRLKLPEDYRKFLKEASHVFVGTLSPLLLAGEEDAVGDLAVTLIEARKIGLPKEWLPICEDNADYYCLVIDTGEVRFWSHDGAADESWPSLAAWVETVWIEEG